MRSLRAAAMRCGSSWGPSPGSSVRCVAVRLSWIAATRLPSQWKTARLSCLSLSTPHKSWAKLAAGPRLSPVLEPAARGIRTWLTVLHKCHRSGPIYTALRPHIHRTQLSSAMHSRASDAEASSARSLSVSAGPSDGWLLTASPIRYGDGRSAHNAHWDLSNFSCRLVNSLCLTFIPTPGAPCVSARTSRSFSWMAASSRWKQARRQRSLSARLLGDGGGDPG
mmetsp:Transcript_119286/g.323609  ORF Transcript_119286/g.323609 Transcript_119286/m.323609 type:complete len:223 (-) Transcript_119286:114-782(-)